MALPPKYPRLVEPLARGRARASSANARLSPLRRRGDRAGHPPFTDAALAEAPAGPRDPPWRLPRFDGDLCRGLPGPPAVAACAAAAMACPRARARRTRSTAFAAPRHLARRQARSQPRLRVGNSPRRVSVGGVGAERRRVPGAATSTSGSAAPPRAGRANAARRAAVRVRERRHRGNIASYPR